MKLSSEKQPSIQRYSPVAALRRKLEKNPVPPPEQNILIVALGDSVTQGLGPNPGGENVYHQRFRRELTAYYPERAFSLINAGIGGDTTRGGLQRLRRDVLDHRPDLVTVCLGLNDATLGMKGTASFQRNLAKIVTRCQEVAAVILLTPNMMATHDSPQVDPNWKSQIQKFVDWQNHGTMDRYVDIIREVATRTATPLADAYAEWKRRHNSGKDMTQWLVNGINHPDARGHRLLADALWKTWEDKFTGATGNRLPDA